MPHLDGTVSEKEIDKAKFARLAVRTVETGVGANDDDVIGTDLGLIREFNRGAHHRRTAEAKDFTSDQEVPVSGCGDYVILNTIRNFLPELGLRRENIVFVSGIGCSSRFPYYLETYGFHSIHGRAPTIATGLAVARELTVGVGRHRGRRRAVHRRQSPDPRAAAKRRLTILLFNNRIYGLTKGQYSPTRRSARTKSTPMGSLDTRSIRSPWRWGPRRRSWAARWTRTARGLSEVLRGAAAHRGPALVRKSCRTARSSTTGHSTRSARRRRGTADPRPPRRADHVRRRWPVLRGQVRIRPGGRQDR